MLLKTLIYDTDFWNQQLFLVLPIMFELQLYKI